MKKITLDITVSMTDDCILKVTSKAMNHEGYCRGYNIEEYVKDLALSWAEMIIYVEGDDISVKYPE